MKEHFPSIETNLLAGLCMILIGGVTMTKVAAEEHALPELNVTLGAAAACVDGDVLVVRTGQIERRWKWTGKGLVTVGLKDLQGNHEFVNLDSTPECDWTLPISVEEPVAKLESLLAEKSTDDGFTTEHLAVTATVTYPSSGLTMKYVVWAYPDAPGLRTQLLIKGKPEPAAKLGDLVDFLPVSRQGMQARAIGYYNNTQHRHTAKTPLIREELVDTAVVDWASILCLEDDQGGVAMVKESHKCVNQSGVFTGKFRVEPRGLFNTGLGFDASHLKNDRFRACWASWLIVYGAGDAERELALKRFGRARFPIKPTRDMYVKADTWGSGNNSRESRNKGMEVEVLKEIDSVADLGLDGLQIDDGWQLSSSAGGWQPDGGIGWRPHPEAYPEGWKRVKASAKAKGVHLGLWAPAEAISLEDLKWNYDQVGFWTWKLDFANMSTPDKIEQNIKKIREFIAYTDHHAQMAWDVTENAARYGYYWAQEYGCIWLSNRKPEFPTSTIPKPWLMLRENWELAKYVNINKFQLPVQNFQRVDRTKSDAYKHSHTYEVALGLMGVPVFFQTTYYYQGDARDEIRDLISRYKQHREQMFTSYVFPIGEEPSNASWAGFQWHHPGRDSGHLMIFRELNNKQQKKKMTLRFLAGTTLKLLDIRSGQEKTIEIDNEGKGLFTLANPADVLFCRYEILKK